MSDQSTAVSFGEQSQVEYLPIEGFPGYRVGNDGTVWSCVRRGCRPILTNVWKKLNPKNSKGYPEVGLWKGCRRICRKVHRLVLEAFVGLRPPGMECRHFPDRDPFNNRLSNLQWGTHAENDKDQDVHGTRTKGSRQGLARLTEADIPRIRKMLADGMRQVDVAKTFKVSRHLIWHVAKGRTWQHIK